MLLNVLVLGGGGREHAICEALLRSQYLKKLFLACPNDGFKHLGEAVEFNDFDDLAKKAVEKNIDMLIVGGEDALCEGIADIFEKRGIKCIGVNRRFSRLEGSKTFAKKFMDKYGIKNARVLNGLEKAPYVIKEDSLAKGKGVFITSNKNSAQKKIAELQKKNKNYFIEEFLDGEEFSLMSLYDGENLLNFVCARDFKKLYDGKDAPNTGGMGSFCPVTLSEKQKKALEKYTEKLANALKSEKADFTGFIYSGLVWHNDDFWVLEYNVRLGDPECQSLLTHLESDFLEVLIFACEKKLSDVKLKWRKGTSATLVIASKGYPDLPFEHNEIENIFPADAGGLIFAQEQNSDAEIFKNVKIYFSGVKKENEKFYSKSGRNICLCTTEEKPFETLYKAAKIVKMKNKYYRKDLCT